MRQRNEEDVRKKQHRFSNPDFSYKNDRVKINRHTRGSGKRCRLCFYLDRTAERLEGFVAGGKQMPEESAVVIEISPPP